MLGLDFEERCDEPDRGFAHVCHVAPLRGVDGSSDYRLDPAEDLRPVCPNRHSMLQRPRNRTPAVEELRSCLEDEPGDGTRTAAKSSGFKNIGR